MTDPTDPPGSSDLIGNCTAMREVIEKLRKTAPTDITVLITGETGTGKELIARELHRRSRRSAAPFVTIDCTTIPHGLIESELFGHAKGAFTGADRAHRGKFQEAHGGTVFLDELGELPLDLQAKLLRVLEQREVVPVGTSAPRKIDIRVVAATNRDPVEEVRAARFRGDLLHRLNAVSIHMPPLRERAGDMILLAKSFLGTLCSDCQSPAEGFTDAALAALQEHDWPGNIRELKNRIRAAVVLGAGRLLTPADLCLSPSPAARDAPTRERTVAVVTFLRHLASDQPAPSLHQAWNRGGTRPCLSGRGKVAQELEDAFNGARQEVGPLLAALPPDWKAEITDAITKLMRKNKRPLPEELLRLLGCAPGAQSPAPSGSAPRAESPASSGSVNAPPTLPTSAPPTLPAGAPPTLPAVAPRAPDTRADTLQSSFTEMEPPRVSIGRLPSTAPEVFGRQKETKWLDDAWSTRAHVVSIVAFGGVGKSTLVSEWLRDMQRDGWRGAERVYGWSFYDQGTTEGKTSSEELISAALRWFGDPDPRVGSSRDKGERLAELVRQRRTLLVLDGIEPLQWGPGEREGLLKDEALSALLRELGAQNNGLCVISSRMRIRDMDDYAGEKCRRLALERLSSEAGASLLRSRNVKGTEEELRKAADEYQGHSLALALLGSYLEEAYRGDVRRRFEIAVIEDDERLGGHARRVMSAYERLLRSGPELGILRMLGLFDRPATEAEIAVLTSAPPVPGLTDSLCDLDVPWNTAVARLGRLGLVVLQPGGALDAHPLVREHFGAQLRQASTGACREGHRRLYEHLKEVAAPLPDTIEDMVPLYEAVAHGCMAGLHPDAFHSVYQARINRGAMWFNQTHLGAHSAEITVLAAFFDPPWQRPAAELGDTEKVFVLNAAGVVLRALGRLSEAARLIQQGLEGLLAVGETRNAAVAALNLSELWQSSGDLSRALSCARQGTDLAGGSGDPFMKMSNRARLATVLHQMDRLAEAREQFEEAARIHREETSLHAPLFSPLDVAFHGAPGGTAVDSLPRKFYTLAAFSYDDLLLDSGRHAEAAARAAATLPWFESEGWILWVGLMRLTLARAHVVARRMGAEHDMKEAAEHLRCAVQALRRAGYQDYLCRGLLAWVELHTLTGDLVQARRELDQVFAVTSRCGFRLYEADAYLALASIALAEDDRGAAKKSLVLARQLAMPAGYHRRRAEIARLERALA